MSQLGNPKQKFVLYIFTILIVIGLLVGCVELSTTPTPSFQPTNTIQPTNTDVPLPDLIINSVSISTASENLCADSLDLFALDLEIKNQGEGDAGSFVVIINVAQAQSIRGLPSGEAVLLKFPYYNEQVDATVDPENNVTESNEANNNFSQIVFKPTLPPECIQTPTVVTRTLKPTAIMEGHTAVVESVDFSPNGKLIASGSVDNTIRLFRVTEAVLLRTMYGHPFPIYTLRYSPDGAYLATGSSDNIIRIWRVSDGQLISTLEGHGGRVVDLEFSPDGSHLASCAEDFTVRIWRISNSRLVKNIDEGMSSVNDISYSPDGKSIAWVEENGMLRVWDLAMDLNTLAIPKSQPARSVSFSPDGESIAVGYADGIINIWNISRGNLSSTLTGHTQSVSGLAFSFDGTWLVSGSHDTTLRLWQSQGNRGTAYLIKYVLESHTGPVNCVSFSPSSLIIASCSDDNNIYLWTVPES